MQKQKISGGQLIGIIFWSIMGTALISLPTLISIHAPRDAWTVAVIFTIGGAGLCLVIGALAREFPDRGFVSYVQEVMGIWLGKLLLMIFLVWLFHNSSFVIWQIGSFTNLSLLPNAPFSLVLIVIVLPAAYAVYGGIESISRCGQFIFLPTTLILFLLFLLHIPEANLQNLMPVFGDGISNILRASLAPLAWAGEIMLVLFLVPYIKDNGKITRYSVITITLVGLGGFVNEFFFTAVFGPLRRHLINPFFTIVRYIRPTAFIERYDIFFVAVILLGNFVKLSVFIYIFVLCLSQLLGMKSYRPLVIPATAGLLLLASYSVKSPNQFIIYTDTVFPFYTIPLLYGFPLFVLIVAKIRGKTNMTPGSGSTD